MVEIPVLHAVLNLELVELAGSSHSGVVRILALMKPDPPVSVQENTQYSKLLFCISIFSSDGFTTLCVELLDVLATNNFATTAIMDKIAISSRIWLKIEVDIVKLLVNDPNLSRVYFCFCG